MKPNLPIESLKTSASLLGIGLASVAPTATVTQASVADYTIYGVIAKTNELLRFRFADSSGDSVGKVRFLQTGVVLDDIEASAYIPTSLNIVGVWLDSSADLARMLYIDTRNATARIAGQHLQRGRITGAVAATDRNPHIPVQSATQRTSLKDIRAHKVYAIQ